ncbi:MAG: hypothetical protein LQ352_004211 [Teloschistes flavicans]|nr:MAG: hypothetical protein LQ352_004211 [Teloschistes flavicans]
MKYILALIVANLLPTIIPARPTATEITTVSKRVISLPPPGPQPYIYPVPYSDIILSCRYQAPQQQQDTTSVDSLLKRLMGIYSDPSKRATQVFHYSSQKYQFVEGDWVHHGEVAFLRGPAYHSTLQPRGTMTWDNVVNTVLGYNHLRHQYPGFVWGFDVYEAEHDGAEKKYLGFFCVRGFNSKFRTMD